MKIKEGKIIKKAKYNQCEFCLEEISWCKCPQDCAEGNHNFSQSFRCQCGVTRYKLLNNLKQK